MICQREIEKYTFQIGPKNVFLQLNHLIVEIFMPPRPTVTIPDAMGMRRNTAI